MFVTCLMFITCLLQIYYKECQSKKKIPNQINWTLLVDLTNDESRWIILIKIRSNDNQAKTWLAVIWKANTSQESLKFFIKQSTRKSQFPTSIQAFFTFHNLNLYRRSSASHHHTFTCLCLTQLHLVNLFLWCGPENNKNAAMMDRRATH